MLLYLQLAEKQGLLLSVGVKKGCRATLTVSIICRPCFALPLSLSAPREACKVNAWQEPSLLLLGHMKVAVERRMFPAGSEGALVSVCLPYSHVSFSCWM